MYQIIALVCNILFRYDLSYITLWYTFNVYHQSRQPALTSAHTIHVSITSAVTVVLNIICTLTGRCAWMDNKYQN